MQHAAAHQLQQVEVRFCGFSLRLPPAYPACCLSVFYFFEEVLSLLAQGACKVRETLVPTSLAYAPFICFRKKSFVVSLNIIP